MKALNLEDNIKNRDSVRDRVLELLILEKEKIESEKFNIKITDDELKASYHRCMIFQLMSMKNSKTF